ncbi:MAG: hypothetical protein CME64_03490 [Halobacteriovoraceae bacterium]|nr:hypothetical protein [Halobacteriovoraceae bacterium]|tara:strand:+ start:31346 stop:32416 length:1071 start_codon:yes stop_codon:yes gene_type:complete
MNAKKWVMSWFTILSISLMLIGSFNLLIDPMWIFTHTHPLNTLQRAFDERKLKSFYLKNRPKTYDSLLLGSSRTAYYNHKHFNGMRVFNYSSSGAKPYEFYDFIENFKQYNELKNLIIGFDYFGSMLRYKEDVAAIVNSNKLMLKEVNTRGKLEHFLLNYWSIDITRHSLINLYRSVTNTSSARSYNRANENIVTTEKIPKSEIVEPNFNRYYPKNHKYISNFKSILNNISKESEGANLIVFTTPISTTLLRLIHENEGLYANYKRWIKDLVSAFPKVYFTTYLNPLAQNYKVYSRDGHHYYPFINSEISRYITLGKTSNTDVSDSIKVLTEENVDNFLRQIDTIHTEGLTSTSQD